MILITGGYCQGKRAWAAEYFSLEEHEVADGASCSRQELLDCSALDHFHLLVRRWLLEGEDIPAMTEMLLRENPGLLVLTDEIGSGIIPVDAFERKYREAHGRACCRIAEQAEAVVRVVCGIGTFIKDVRRLMTIRVIRHGQTYGNTLRRFLGKTDEPLIEEGRKRLQEIREAGIWGNVGEGALFSSPMLRCRQTAQILFPGLEPVLLPGMEECDFGIMENKNHEELDGDPQYQAWIDSGGRAPFPGGESLEGFSERIVTAFGDMLDQMADKDMSEAALVCHGGSIMSITEVLVRPHREYFSGLKGNGCGYVVQVDYDLWKNGRKECRILKEVDM